MVSLDSIVKMQQQEIIKHERKNKMRKEVNSQLSLIKTIKNCILFFTVLTIIGMVAYFLNMMNAL